AANGVGPHTISVPRIRTADDINPDDFTNAVSDEIFNKIVAILRLAVPYTGIIISTRESEKTREKVIRYGVSQVSGASCTSVGGYADIKDKDAEQFEVSDSRTLDEVVEWLLELGYIPSFCTACYREGRTGDRFMSLAKSGQIHNCCQPNALMTLREYANDYARPHTRELAYKMIKDEIPKIENEKVREVVLKNLISLDKGERDFRF
ncbi:MAG: [FeFe] hydrogenase H-cluster radical SAM maturase HydG, partial [Oscillospiraceae bacterium]